PTAWRLGLVIPTLNAASALPSTLEALKTGIGAGLEAEVIVVDGGSSDATLTIAEAFGCRILRCSAGRGSQLRAGCAAARLEWVLT
ncbi:glycosyltransferase, partial [Staphylococcus aureus]|uniref:glycosyltransferase n=1 Tax=Staphylococcus aureus TaxID=1280 RepID=UPI001330A3C1